ncbi:hypothetical protein [Nocardiopsis valliformis]|uniref:hypothetical protein n=1 Tax=Nocardiopsis valliformis TaxID=239974 RepID=UPI00034AB7C6|nr:hypothetical protein [Nocardiopsis valliformis]
MIFTLTLPQLLLLLTLTVGVAHTLSLASGYVADRFVLVLGPGRPRLVWAWYGMGATVHHPTQGECQVVDVDLYTDPAACWVRIAPTTDESDSGRWVPVAELAETRAELLAGGEDR